MFILNIILYCALLSGTKCLCMQRSGVGARARERQILANWGSWHAVRLCSVSCGGEGLIERERECSTGVRQDCLNVGGDYYEVTVCNEGPCATGATTWLEWTCSSSCEGGFQQVHRDCSTGHNVDCEKQGGNSWSVSLCHQKPCIPIDGHWSHWTQWSSCSVTCATGNITRSRTCSNPTPVNGGQQCNGLGEESDACNLPKCPTWSDWGPLSTCPKTCDTGVAIRHRNCSSGVNSDCVGGQSYELQPCKLVDCNITTTTMTLKTTKIPPSWSAWHIEVACSTSCGPGFREQTRNCSSGNNNDCPGSYFEVTICNKQSCEVDGIWTQWSPWETCPVTCGVGHSSRTRACNYPDPAHKGQPCAGVIAETNDCNINVCPANGALNEWSTWSDCSHTCQGGKRSRSRVCLYPPGFDNGLPCPGGTLETQNCGLRECPVDGIWSTWYPWSQCTVTCGTGRAVRNRTCTFHTRYPDTLHGEECNGDQAQANDCNTDLCPVDARWSTWSAFSTCSQTCGGGQRTKTRQCIYDRVAPMGLDCTGQSTVTEECSTNECPIDGVIQPWNSWTYCSASCGGGVHTRTRDCYFPTNRPHGDDCSEPINETAPCNVQSCPTTTTTPPTTTLPTADGHWSNWTSWTVCTLTCGGGQQYRKRQCTYPDHTLHGQYCPGPQNQTQECNTRLCPVDGIWTQWSAYSKCSVSCAVGFQTRTRQCQFDPKYDRGNNCTGNDTATQSCNNGPCPVDGVFENWSTWTACPVTCGGGIQDRTRVCHFPTGAPHGLDCLGVTHENQTCGNSDCPVDGVFTEWSLWADCTVTCGPGLRLKNRTCYFPPDKPHGHDCVGNLNFTKACANHECPVDGEWNDWAQWAKCSVTCGGGTHQRTRRCHYVGHHSHGAPCPGPDTETSDCSTNHCPIDGIWHTWNSWTSCSVTCSNGTKSRARQCFFVPNEPKGNNCSGSEKETLDCNLGLCPVDGVWHSWSAWSACTVTCGNGTSSRGRVCNFPANTPHGRNCIGSNAESHSCNAVLCPVDGHWSDWTQWSSCSVTCATGNITRSRTCSNPAPVNGGQQCNGLGEESDACNLPKCPMWSSWFSGTCSVTCGQGHQARVRHCSTGNSADCAGPAFENATCHASPCAVDGHWSEWSTWSQCDVTCASGYSHRARNCSNPKPLYGGSDCQGVSVETTTCILQTCPTWSQWFTGECSVTCGRGSASLLRMCSTGKDSDCSGTPFDDVACYKPAC